MPTTQLPLMKGTGKDYGNADYLDLLPVNMLATPKEILSSSGYLRSFPGVVKRDDVDGASRGAQFNTSQNAVYRVIGSKLYKGRDVISEVPGRGRVGMAHSSESQAVAVSGTLRMYRYDGGIRQLTNWNGTTYPQYDLGKARDVCRLRGRYIWVKDGTDTFGVTDLEDEARPDKYRPFYQAESQPDGIQGCGAWRDFAVMFGTSTIEFFTLTGSTDTSAAIYVAQPSYMVNKGIAGTYCKVQFANSYAFISHPATGAPSVYVIDSGQITSIATASVEKILRSYTSDELASSFMETVRFDSHELLLLHLPRHVLCYDAAASQNGPQWTLLKSGAADDVHRAVDYMYEGNEITVGDKSIAVTGTINFDIASQYGAQTEHVLFTPLFKADNARVFDMELESSSGAAQRAEKLFISATPDGINYGREQMLSANAPFIYDRRVLWRRIGRIRKNIGFKVRIVTSSPVTLSGCSVRIE